MVDYDERLHAVYAEGRKLAPEGLHTWMREFAELAPPQRPLTVLDLGCGIGRFTPALADTFGGPVYGVEPSDQMRRQAAAHPAVTYLMRLRRRRSRSEATRSTSSCSSSPCIIGTINCRA